jgi:protease II
MNKKSIEDYFNINAAGGADYHPITKCFIFTYNATGIQQIYSQDLNSEFDPKQLTFREDRCTNPVYLPNGDILYSSDTGGNENFQFFVISENQHYQLTNDLTVKHRYAFVNEDAIYFSANLSDKQRFDIFRYNFPISEKSIPELIVEGKPQTIMTPVASRDNIVLYNIYYGNTHVEPNIFDLELKINNNLVSNLLGGSKARIYAVDLIDEDRIIVLSDMGREFLGVALFSLSSNQLTYLEPDNWDVIRVVYQSDADSIIYGKNIDGIDQLFFSKLTNPLEPKKLPLPAENGNLISGDLRSFLRSFVLNPGGDGILISYASASKINNIWELDIHSSELKQQTYASGPALPSFIEPDLARFKSFDGLEVPYFIYKPLKTKEHIPTMLIIHGGPEGQITPAFNKIIQYFLSLGIAIVTPNIRGSSGYGKTYLSLDDKGKRLDSIADINALTEHLKTTDPSLDPEKFIIYGGSYGGFAVLSSITEYPDIWAAAIDIVGISNFVTFLKNTAEWRRKLREVEYGSLDEDLEILIKISPIHKINQVKAPTIVIQGDNDERVPLSEALQVYEKLKKNGVKTELLRFADEGHGVVKRNNQLVMYEKISQFLYDCDILS